MNKQAITFLSLFSLILVLSVYYILLPPLNNTELPVTIVEEDTSQVVSMQQNLDQQRLELIKENNEIIAASNSEKTEIEIALQTIENTKNIIQQEETINSLLNEAGYENIFAEINGNNIKIVIEKNDATTTDANAVIKIIMNEFGNAYHVEVKFVES